MSAAEPSIDAGLIVRIAADGQRHLKLQRTALWNGFWMIVIFLIGAGIIFAIVWTTHNIRIPTIILAIPLGLLMARSIKLSQGISELAISLSEPWQLASQITRIRCNPVQKSYAIFCDGHPICIPYTAIEPRVMELFVHYLRCQGRKIDFY